MLELVVGEKTEYEGIDIIRENESVKFGTVEEFFEQTDFDVLYPDKLPDGVVIEMIHISDYSDYNLNLIQGYKQISFITNRMGKISIGVATLPEDKNFEGTTYKKIGEYDCYVGIDKDIVTCDFIYNNNSYYIHAPTYEDVVTIVSNMKKFGE